MYHRIINIDEVYFSLWRTHTSLSEFCLSLFSEFNVISIGRGYPIEYNNRDGKVSIFDREIEPIIM